MSAALGDRRRQSLSALLARDKWTEDDLLYGVYGQAAADWPAGRPALGVLDTCFYDFRSHRACRGLGSIGTGGKGRGLCSQAALLLSEGGQPQGLLGLWNWTRGADSGLPWPAEEPESSRWCKGIVALQERLPGVPLTIIMDAEGDAYEVFLCPRREEVELLVRVAQDRRVELEEPEEWEAADRLKACVAGGPEAGTMVVQVPRQAAREGKPAQKARQATLTLRYRRVWLKPPERLPKGTPRVRVSLILAREESPPEGVEGLEWYRLTTRRVETVAGAIEVCRTYGYRWRIEQAHRVLKEPMRFERLQLDDSWSLSRALALYWPLAVRALWLRYEASEAPERPAGEVFEEDELAVLQSQAREPMRTVVDAVRALGKLGGWVGGRKAELPGAGVLLRGLHSLSERVAGYRLARETAADYANTCSDTS
ncbi:MAG: IS4 family transposase [Armatimonadetes bacterium]|nr:IS4 family transposase [Armatimonadota bacterium]